jgi:hypothetical protein
MKIRPVGAEFTHADGRKTDRRTDMTKLIVAFCNFANALKKKQLADEDSLVVYQSRGLITMHLSHPQGPKSIHTNSRHIMWIFDPLNSLHIYVCQVTCLHTFLSNLFMCSWFLSRMYKMKVTPGFTIYMSLFSTSNMLKYTHGQIHIHLQ